jgi:DNA-binding winged helix-turn-helix (wHTH) protein
MAMDGAGFFAAERRWQVGCVTYDEGSRELRVAGERRPIEAKPLQLLLRLLEAEGKIVCQRDLLIAAWGNAEIPTLTSLQTAISKLRRVLGPEETGLIEVASGQGYRLSAWRRARCKRRRMTRRCSCRRRGASGRCRPRHWWLPHCLSWH